MTGASQQAFEEAAQRIPEKGSWGHFFYCDGPPAAGGGAGSFCWFKDSTAQLDFISNWQAFICPGPSGADIEAVQNILSTAVAIFCGGYATAEEARREFNRTLKGFSKIEWWGRFEDLYSGDGAFERKVRAWFRDEEDESPIHADERKAFAEMLLDYGL